MRENTPRIETLCAFKMDSRTTNVSVVQAETIRYEDWLIKISGYDYN